MTSEGLNFTLSHIMEYIEKIAKLKYYRLINTIWFCITSPVNITLDEA